MSELNALFDKRNGRKLLMPYLTVGYPSLSQTIEAAEICALEGCDALELGIPFSDPLADGVTIQRASHAALQNGVDMAVCLKAAGEIHGRFRIPVIFMTYLNPVFNYGIADFCRAAAGAGVSGLIVPDLPPDEGGEMEAAAGENNIDLVYLATQNSTEARLKLVAERSRGFIYVVSLIGVTGTREELSPDLVAFIRRLRAITNRPLCIGFGISTPKQAAGAAAIADGVIIGSRIMQIMEEGENSLTELRRYLKQIRAAVSI